MNKNLMREGYKQVCMELKPTAFVTLVTNQNWNVAQMKSLSGRYFRHMDRWLLGSNWTKKPWDMRTDGIGFVEHIQSNIHVHFLVRFAKGNLYGQQLKSDYCWKNICASGSVKIKPIYHLETLVEYCTKEMNYRQYNDLDQLIFLKDYTRL